MSTSHTYAQRNTQLIPSRTHQTPPDTAAATTQCAPFSLRPICVSDREGLSTLFARLSPESRYRRFLTGKPALSDRELTYLTEVDHVRHEALTAIDPADGSIVGVARYATWPGRAGEADVAIEVADDLHRNGVGLMLAQALIRRARENGINVLTATTLWENHAARSLARRVGFRARASAGNELELELQLPPTILDHADRNGDDGQSGRRLAHIASPPRHYALLRGSSERIELGRFERHLTSDVGMSVMSDQTARLSSQSFIRDGFRCTDLPDR